MDHLYYQHSIDLPTSILEFVVIEAYKKANEWFESESEFIGYTEFMNKEIPGVVTDWFAVHFFGAEKHSFIKDDSIDRETRVRIEYASYEILDCIEDYYSKNNKLPNPKELIDYEIKNYTVY
jgi:hypothetical protein